MSESGTSFLSSPSNVISSLALIVSSLALFNAWRNQKAQNKLWDALNAPNLNFKRGDLKTWKKLSEATADAMRWGYKPAVLLSVDGDECRVVGRLKAHHQDGKPLSRMNQCITTEELEAELKRIQQAPEEIKISREMRFLLELYNSGKTEAKRAVSRVYVRDSESRFRQVFASIAPVDVPAGESVTIPIDILDDPHGDVPEWIVFKIETEFGDSRQITYAREVIRYWNAYKNEWGAGVPAGVK